MNVPWAQYMPADLINPRSRLSGKKPILKDVTNWYFKLEEFQPLLQEWVDYLKTLPNTRPMLQIYWRNSSNLLSFT